MDYINATAEVSPCNIISAILGQQKACAQIAMIMNGRGLSPPPPFQLRSLYTHTSYHLTWHKAPIIHRSHELTTISSFLAAPFAFLPKDTFTIHGVPSRIRLCRTVHDLALSAILATDDPREQKCLDRHIRHFDRFLTARMRTFSPPRQPG